ncbi:MAG: class I SAM-dependent methyltransferase [Zoogloeaceae bacterium]|nr:class I SAM-dependent methyltransferase [Zoogloeaceae bacterium]
MISENTLATSCNVETLGQVFTPKAVVDVMLSLRRRQGRVLEPSCGNGAFSNVLSGCVALEIDSRHAPAHSLDIDFFAYPEFEKFETIIGNPPYVRYQDITPSTKALLNTKQFDGRSNLYLFFIEKAVRHLAPHGEIIFITPRDFIKNTSSVKLNQWLYANGTITDAIELGDAKIFDGAVPNCLIWRYEKDCFNRMMRYAEIGIGTDVTHSLNNLHWENRYFQEYSGHFMFTSGKNFLTLKDIASVKVGAVSGADDIYENEEYGTLDFVCSKTVRTGETRRMIWVNNDNCPPECLLPHKNRLLSRRIRAFDESNWWHWGRGFPINDMPRIYVNGKTRNCNPFFVHDCKNFDGSILAIFPRDISINVIDLCSSLNQVDWAEIGFVCGGRFLFTQRSLEHAPLPECFSRFLLREKATLPSAHAQKTHDQGIEASSARLWSVKR